MLTSTVGVDSKIGSTNNERGTTPPVVLRRVWQVGSKTVVNVEGRMENHLPEVANCPKGQREIGTELHFVRVYPQW